MLKNPVGRVRVIGMIEGVSALILYFVAVPLKRLPALQSLSGQPEMGKDVVLWVGSIHGALFTAYAAVAIYAWRKGYLSNKLLRNAAIASILPFGPFVIDRRLKAVEETQPPTA